MTQMFPMYFTLYYNLHDTLIVIWQTDNTKTLWKNSSATLYNQQPVLWHFTKKFASFTTTTQIIGVSPLVTVTIVHLCKERKSM